MKRTMILCFITLTLIPAWFYGNNITVSNVELTGQTSTYVYVQFDLSWENSWRLQEYPFNYDAVWVFVKFRVYEGYWQHATLSSSSAGHIVPAGAALSAVSDGKGVFIYRSGYGSGNNIFNTVKLRWNYAADGVQQGDFKQVKVMGIEMVYIPQGDYFLGDGLANGTFRQVGNLNPAPVTQSSIIVKCNGTSYDDPQLEGAGILVDGDDGIDKDGTTAVDNPDYPMGFKAFYIMKYEISQGQWANFLNLLTPGQAQVRYYQTSSNRYTLSGNAPSIVAAAPDRACNFLSWMDGCAYADWSGLRPLTELEHEKVCRGIAAPVSGEYAWGNTSICSTAYTLANNGQPNELITNPCTNTGNASYFTTSYYYITGPLRCGICAASAVNQTRQETGASFYGVMELSGNLSERTVTLGNIAGRSYTAIHGNGMLSAEGHADVENWPGMQGVVISGAEGSGFRGGDWSYAADYLQVSSRYNAAYAYTDRNYNSGFRCGRSAP